MGRDVPSAAAVRAGISGFTQHPFMIDGAGEPMCVAMGMWLDPDCQGVDRMEALLVPAAEQACTPECNSEDPPVASRWRRRAAAGLAHDLDAKLRTTISRTFPNRFAAIATFMRACRTRRERGVREDPLRNACRLMSREGGISSPRRWSGSTPTIRCTAPAR